MIDKNQRLKLILITIALILLAPLVAMQFTDEVNWNVFDFIVAAILLGSAGLVFEFIQRSIKKSKYRIILSATILIVLLLTWIELAVGIFGTPFAGN
ncbi:MAG: hypothetical protein WC967_08705 [Balneolaceae bacterium]